MAAPALKACATLGPAPAGTRFWPHRGFVIWQLDNRGSAGRGHAFETPIYHRMGKTELADQLEGIRYLTSRASWIRRVSAFTAGATAAT